MTKEEMIEAINSVTNVNRQIATIYEVLSELGVKFEKTSCSRCRRDLLLIAKEELGLIDNAADESDFNADGVWTLKRAVIWNGVKLTRDSDQSLLDDFRKAIGREANRYFKYNNNID